MALRAHLLTADRPDGLVRTVEHLTHLPVDMTAAVAPSPDLVAWSRLGSSYSPSDLGDALAARELWEDLDAIRPMADLPLHLAAMAAGPEYDGTREWLEANELFRAEVLDVLAEADEPLLSSQVHATPQVPWRSSGWNENRSVALMLQVLARLGEVAVDGRVGNRRRWTLAERVFPAGVEAVPAEEATRVRDERRLHALGIARAGGTRIPGEPIHVGDAGEPGVVEGVPGEWRVDPGYLAGEDEGGGPRTALLSPFDALVRDRVRMQELFGFEYVLEMYKPAARRRWGYFALPILHGDRLVGKLDAAADRRGGRLFVDAVHEDGRWTRSMRSAVDDEVSALAAWLGLRRD